MLRERGKLMGVQREKIAFGTMYRSDGFEELSAVKQSGCIDKHPLVLCLYLNICYTLGQ